MAYSRYQVGAFLPILAMFYPEPISSRSKGVVIVDRLDGGMYGEVRKAKGWVLTAGGRVKEALGVGSMGGLVMYHFSPS